MSKANEQLSFKTRETIRGHLLFLVGKATTCGDDLELAGKYANETFKHILSALSQEEKSVNTEMLEALKEFVKYDDAKLRLDLDVHRYDGYREKIYLQAKDLISRAEAQGGE